MGGSLLGKEQLLLTARLLFSDISSSRNKICNITATTQDSTMDRMESGLGNGDRQPEKELK